MAMVKVEKLLFLTLLLVWFNTLTLSQGKLSWKEQYPFIKPASTFSSATSSSSSSATSSSHGGKNNPTFDYIVIGGGTAGCPLAATLSRNFTVLVLERGGVPFENLNVSLMENFHISLADLSDKSASQFFQSTDGVLNSRARVLGGGTAINAGFYTRASTRFVQEVGWDSKLVNESYPWVEEQIVHLPDLAPYQKAIRDGLLEIGVDPFNGFTYDHMYGTKVGGTIFDKFGRRHTAAELLGSANPEKITVLVHATVQKVIFDTTGKKPRATGVIFHDENGNQHTANLARRRGSEVIVSCGAIGSPQLLLLSGIGPKADLEKMNISVVQENEFVGKGMSDNPLNCVFVPSKSPVQQSLIQTVGITKHGVYIEASSGFGQKGDSLHSHHGILSGEIGQLSTIPPKQRSIEAMKAYSKIKKDLPYEAFQGGFILEKIAFPISKGQLSLINTNASNNPNVTFNYFSHPDDVKKCVDGIKIVEQLLKSTHLSNFTQVDNLTLEMMLNMSVKANFNIIPKQTNDTTSVEQFCKDTVISIWHYHGGCHVGRVVRLDYRVLNVHRLRVVDGSTFWESPGTNPQATVMMMGRYMGVKILRDRLGDSAGV